MMLITGATGTVGREVVRRLSAQGVEVRAVTRDPRNVDANRLPHVEFVHGDFEDLESMRLACAGVDRAFLLTNSTARAPGRFLRYRAAVEAAVRASGLTFTFLRPNLYMQGLLNFGQSIHGTIRRLR